MAKTRDIYDLRPEYRNRIIFSEDEAIDNGQVNTYHYQDIILDHKSIGWIRAIEYRSPAVPLNESFWISTTSLAGDEHDGYFFGKKVDKENNGIQFTHLQDAIDFYVKYRERIEKYIGLAIKEEAGEITREEMFKRASELKSEDIKFLDDKLLAGRIGSRKDYEDTVKPYLEERERRNKLKTSKEDMKGGKKEADIPKQALEKNEIDAEFSKRTVPTGDTVQIVKGGITMTEQKDYVRKTKTILENEKFIGSSFGQYGEVKVGWIKGEVKTYSDPAKNKYRADFLIGLKAPEADGKFPEKTEYMLVSHESSKPIEMEGYENGQKPLILTGQRFMISPREVSGKIKGDRREVFLTRSILEAVKGDTGQWKGGAAVSDKNDSLKTEVERASKEILTGYIYASNDKNVFNQPIEYTNEAGEKEIVGYGHTVSVNVPVMKDGKPLIKDDKPEWQFVRGKMKTKEELSQEEIEAIQSPKDGEKKRLLLHAALHLRNYKTKDGQWVNNAVEAEINKVSVYLDKEIAKEGTPELDPNVTHPRKDKGVYKGEIVSINEDKRTFAQQCSPKLLVEHSYEDLPITKWPQVAIGENKMIKYKNGKIDGFENMKDEEKGLGK